MYVTRKKEMPKVAVKIDLKDHLIDLKDHGTNTKIRSIGGREVYFQRYRFNSVLKCTLDLFKSATLRHRHGDGCPEGRSFYIPRSLGIGDTECHAGLCGKPPGLVRRQKQRGEIMGKSLYHGF